MMSHPPQNMFSECQNTCEPDPAPSRNGSVLQQASNSQTSMDIRISIVVLGGLLATALIFVRLHQRIATDLSAQFLLPLAATFATFPPLALLERIFPAGPHKSIDGWALNLRIAVLHFFGAAVTSVIGASVVAALARHYQLGWVDLRFANHGGVVIQIASIVVSLFIGDFFFYWTHRFGHKSAVLWQQHKVHHMDEQMNVSTLSRVDWLEYMIRILSITIPITLLFKLDSSAAGLTSIVAGAVITTWPAFYHSNIKAHLGWASLVVVGPQVHRIHHSRLPEHRDKNFAGLFPIWDSIFGTYYHPKRDEFPLTGVADEAEVHRFVDAVMLPFSGWLRIWRAFRSRHYAMGAR